MHVNSPFNTFASPAKQTLQNHFGFPLSSTPWRQCSAGPPWKGAARKARCRGDDNRGPAIELISRRISPRKPTAHRRVATRCLLSNGISRGAFNFHRNGANVEAVWRRWMCNWTPWRSFWSLLECPGRRSWHIAFRSAKNQTAPLNVFGWMWIPRSEKFLMRFLILKVYKFSLYRYLVKYVFLSLVQ